MSDALAGEITANGHRLPVRIYYEDTDFSGLVYYANYLKFFERGRSDYLRLLGIHHHELADLDEPLAFAVAEVQVKYARPARIDDVVSVTSRLTAVQGASFTLAQSVERDGVVLVKGEVTIVCIDLKGRPKRLPKALLAIIKAQVSDEKTA